MRGATAVIPTKERRLILLRNLRRAASDSQTQKRLALLITLALVIWVMTANIQELRSKKAQLEANESKIESLQKEKELLEHQSRRLKKKQETLQKKRENLKKELKETKKKLSRKKQRQRASYGIKVGAERWRDLVAKYFPKSQVNNALKIMSCESGGSPNATNWGDAKITGMPSLGLFQINSKTNWNWSNPEVNIKRASNFYFRRGWQPWSCKRVI